MSSQISFEYLTGKISCHDSCSIPRGLHLPSAIQLCQSRRQIMNDVRFLIWCASVCGQDKTLRVERKTVFVSNQDAPLEFLSGSKPHFETPPPAASSQKKIHHKIYEKNLPRPNHRMCHFFLHKAQTGSGSTNTHLWVRQPGTEAMSILCTHHTGKKASV